MTSPTLRAPSVTRVASPAIGSPQRVWWVRWSQTQCASRNAWSDQPARDADSTVHDGSGRGDVSTSERAITRSSRCGSRTANVSTRVPQASVWEAIDGRGSTSSR